LTIALIIGFLRFPCQFTMDINKNLNGVVVNPHAKRPAARDSENSDAADEDVAVNTVVTDSTMGIRSQLRQGAIKKRKKMGTKIKANRVCKQNASWKKILASAPKMALQPARIRPGEVS
jgi:hypothetical protein